MIEFLAKVSAELKIEMPCAVCGQDYGLTHKCTGIAPMTTPEETAAPPGLRFASVHYFNEAFKILCWDDAAVRRASRDNNSRLYGFVILLISSALPFGLLTLRNTSLGYAVPWGLIASRYLIVLVYSLIWIFLQVGLSHVLAKTLFEAKGGYMAIMRAVSAWAIISVADGGAHSSGLLTGVGGIAVLMLVFEEVDGIERMKAFGLAASMGVLFWIASIWLATGVRPIR